MSQPPPSPTRSAPLPMPANLRSVQPGGGVCYRLELAWGVWRRWWLKRFRPAYVRHMEVRRIGDAAGAPHEVLDPRDLKYCRNQCTADWRPEDDAFAWRGRLRLARWGLAEVLLMGAPLLAATLGLALSPWPWLAIGPAVVLAWLVSFFRDPPREIPHEPDLVVAPADGKVIEIAHLDHDDFIGGPAVRIGLFLSIFNVHINRAPVRARVLELRYAPGRFISATNPRSSLVNESLWIGLESDDAPYRRLVVRQIAGLIARRIVCELRPGEVVERGAAFGMIKLGSRTEITLPAEALCVKVAMGQAVRAGSTVLAQWGAPS